MRRLHREVARGEGGANSWKVEPRNRGAALLTQNQNGRLGFSEAGTPVVTAVAEIGGPGGSGMAARLRHRHAGA